MSEFFSLIRAWTSGSRRLTRIELEKGKQDVFLVLRAKERVGNGKQSYGAGLSQEVHSHALKNGL